MSTDSKPQKLLQTSNTASQRNADFLSPKNSSSTKKHRKIHSSHTSPLRSAEIPIVSAIKTSKAEKLKKIGNFSNIFVKPQPDNQSKSGSRRSSINRNELHLAIEALQAQSQPNLKISGPKSPYLSQRDERVISNMILGQKGSQSNKNSTSTATKLDLHSQLGKDHRRVFEANFKNLASQNQDPAASVYCKSPSETRLISDIIDVVQDNKKAGKFANNQALQSVFNKVGKYVNKAKTTTHKESSMTASQLHLQQIDQTGRNELSRRGSTSFIMPLKLQNTNHYIPSFDRNSNENEDFVHPTAKNSEVCTYSRRSSQGMMSRGVNSVVGSKETSPRAQQKDQAKLNEAKNSSMFDLINKKILKLVEPSCNFILNESLATKEKNIWKKQPKKFHQEDELDFDMIEASMNVYKNLKEENTSLKNNISTNKTYNTSTEDDSKSSANQVTKNSGFFNTKSSISLKQPQSSSKERKGTFPNAFVNNIKFVIEAESKTKRGFEEEAKKSEGRPSMKGGHKKNSKSVNTANAVEMMFKGIQLPVNLLKLKSDKLLTPELSKQNSLNNSRMDSEARGSVNGANEANNYNIPIIRLTTNEDDIESVPNSARMKSTNRVICPSEFDKIRNALISNPINYNGSVQQTPEPSVRDMQTKIIDEGVFRERLIRLIKEHFKNQNKAPSTTLDYYKLVKMIGKGAFGKVYLGKHILTGQQVAIKSIDKQYMKDEHSKKKVFQEVLILKKCNHKNIIKLLEVFENQKYLFIVQEYASDGDLLSYVKERGKLTESEAKNIFLQIVQGIRYCHRHNILHRDIKLDNILLAKGTNVKICDFGVSRFVKPGQMIKEQCGTPAYIAPEILLDKGYEGCYADIWSLGVLLYATITGTMPFKGEEIDELHKAILSGQISFPSHLTEEAKDLLKRMLKVNPYSRIDVEEIENHSWFGGIKKLGEQLSPTSRSIRSGTTSVKNNAVVDKKTMTKNDLFSKKLREHQESSISSFKIETALVKKVEALGFPKDHIIQSVESNSCTHASACYFLIQKTEK